MFRTSLVILFGMVSSFVFADAALAITKAQCQSRGADCSSGVTTCADGFAAIDTCTFLLRDDGACCAPAKKNNCYVEPGKSDRICGSCNIPGLTGQDLAPAYDCGNQPCCSSNPNDTGTSPPPPESSLGVLNYTLLEEIPGQPGASGNLAQYLESLYKFTFWAIGIAALFMLTVGGFMYVTSAGNTARIGTAKTIIVDALLGLIIALFAWLFLYVLNPDLVEGLKLPGLSQVNVSSGTGAGTPAASSTARGNCPNPPDTSANCCPQSASITCQACSDCLAIPSSVPNKGCGLSTCYLNRSLLSKIQAISGVSGWRVTESWPPTVFHASNCHTRGTCADINNSGGETDVDTIKRYYDAFRAAGLNVLYENARDCAPYTAKGINCKSYPQQTNLSSFHVQ